MATGKISSPMPNLVNPTNVIAEKVANIAVPATSSSVWDKLGATATTTPPMSGGLSTSFGTPIGTNRLSNLSTKLLTDTDKYKGIGAAMQIKNRPTQYKFDPGNHGHKHGANGECLYGEQVAGGVGSGAQKGNTVFVDDANWPVTLKEIIGSRMLTQEQLEKASIANVKKLVSVGNPHYIRNAKERSLGTKTENEELYYMFQRMMLEGFIRGVDITKELQKQGGLDISIKEAPLASNPRNIGLSQTLGSSRMDQVGFNAKFWRNANEAEKYQLFMHEIGHNLLNRNHAGDDGDIMKSGGTVRNAKMLMKSKDAYNAMLNEHFGSATNKGTIAITKLNPGSGANQFDPSWFPQLSGEAVKSGGSGGVDITDAPPKSTGPDFNSIFSDFRASNDAQLNSLSQRLEDQQETLGQQMRMQSMNSMPQTSAQVGSVSGGVSPTMAGGQTLAAGSLGLGNFDTTGFAQSLANLGSSDSSVNAGALLSSG